MNLSPILADSTHALLCEDGSTVQFDMLAELVVIQLKGHGHFGNIVHHISRGDWPTVHSALRELFLLPREAQTLSPLAKNLVTMIGSGTSNLISFRPWMLDQVERQTTNLYRHSLERRVDMLIQQTWWP